MRIEKSKFGYIFRLLAVLLFITVLFPETVIGVTLNLQVSSSADDGTEGGIASGAGVTSSRTWTDTGSSVSITFATLDPGKHSVADGNTVSVGARFTNVTVPQGTTITSATFTLTPKITYPSGVTIAFFVSAQNSDNASAFSTTPGMLNATNRPRTTANCGTWDLTSVVANEPETRDVTACVQEVINRAGWVSGNSIAIILDTHTTSSNSEWQDFFPYDDTPSKAPKLDIVYSSVSNTPVVKIRGRVNIRGIVKYR